MKVLVYGIGVIGSLTVHELCKAGNDVTVVSRGCWKEVLERQGLQIHSGKISGLIIQRYYLNMMAKCMMWYFPSCRINSRRIF